VYNVNRGRCCNALMLGLFMLVNFNVGYITDAVKEQVEIVIYIDDRAAFQRSADLENRLNSHPGMAEVRYVSSEEHMNRLQRQLGGMLEGYDSGLENPLFGFLRN
jgi:cell division transport system permease protein